MSLTIEDGTIVEGAESYVTVDEVVKYASDRDYFFEIAEVSIERLIRKTTDYLEGLRDSYKGSKVSSSQNLQWPRQDVSIDDIDIGMTVIPKELKAAQCQLAIELNTNGDLTPSNNEYAVKREKIDVLETEYAVPIGARKLPFSMPKVDVLLAPLLRIKGLKLLRI